MIEKRVKMSELARLSGVPAATIKHYLKEGLLPEPDRTHRNMAYYDASLAPRIRRIKELQRSHFLPLRVIREILAMDTKTDEDAVAQSIAAVLMRSASGDTRTRADLVERGMPEAQLDFLRSIGLLSPTGPDETYSGDDLELLRVLGAARKAGISPEMLPIGILRAYVEAIRKLVAIEMKLFRAGVMPNASKEELVILTQTAATLSERLVVILRRKMLLPTLRGPQRSTTKKVKKNTRH